MARAQKLKVFKLTIGFHDAYVAAPSQKAAAEAWGADKDVFARGQAELVTDEALTAEPLAKPGTIIKRLRGTVEEQLEALGDDPAPPAKQKPAKASKPKPKPKPRPSRAALDKAEQALAEAEERQKKELADLREREAALARERKQIEARHASERDTLNAAVQKQQDRYDTALDAWRG